MHDFGETPDGLIYFIMEFVDGTDVQKMIQASGRLTGEHALAITAHVCDALEYAHQNGVVHRDIKPANVMLTPVPAEGKPDTTWDVTAKVLDVGLGRELFDYAFKEYARRWKFKRPEPSDFFRTMEDAFDPALRHRSLALTMEALQADVAIAA